MPATVVLVIDGLASNLPGPYGNTTVDTPTLNQFAAESELFDFCFAESPMLQDSYPILWKDLVGEGSMLVADCPEVLKLAGEMSFDSIVDASSPPKTELAADIADTQTANFFIHAIEALQALDSDGICWLHHSGLTGAWDAPWEMRYAFADEDDPEPPKEIERPVSTFDPKEVDPDLLLSTVGLRAVGCDRSAAGDLSATAGTKRNRPKRVLRDCVASRLCTWRTRHRWRIQQSL